MADFMELNFPSNFFDCSLSMHTIYHMNKKIQEKAIRKMIKITKPNKPIIIIGESALELKSGQYIVKGFKNFLKNNNFISKEWNAFNFLAQNASTVGLIDLRVLSLSLIHI